MLRRLVHITVSATTVLVVITVILRYFSDILPLASTEPHAVWRFEAAFLLTAAQWIALAVVGLAAVSIVTLIWKSAGPRAS
jgi:hypothetical protein